MSSRPAPSGGPPPPRGTRLLARGPRTVWAVPKAKLLVAEPPGDTLSIGPHAVVVGAEDDCDLRLADSAVSGRHFEIVADPLGLLVRDLGSKNGTFVDGMRVLSAYLRPGAQIVAGETRLDVVVEPQEEEIELSLATSFGGLLGHSPAMRAAVALLERAAKSEATVLLTGESGTGKELAARALHERSGRKGGPFVIWDCGAASPTLLEAQLFGHAKGAFTGAHEAKEGVFEAAHGGTLVLDEIGELPIELQPKLLRALESRTVQRLGETKTKSFDARFVACTHRHLEQQVKAGRFRQDLYYRLSVICVRMPSLRERKEEIGRLFRHFVHKLAGDDAPEVPASIDAVLTAHDWPGNVRELRNFAERFLVLREAAAEQLRGRAIAPNTASEITAFHEAKRDHLEQFERAYFEELFRRHGANLSEAARIAGLSRQTCYRMMSKHGLDIE